MGSVRAGTLNAIQPWNYFRSIPYKWSRYLNDRRTDRRTDRQKTDCGITALYSVSVASRGKKQVQSRAVINDWRTIKPVSVTSLDLYTNADGWHTIPFFRADLMNALELNALKHDEQSSRCRCYQVLTGKYCAINQCTCVFCVSKNSCSRFLWLVFAGTFCG